MCTYVMECVVRPDIEVHKLIETVQRSVDRMNTQGNLFQFRLVNSSHASIMRITTPTTDSSNLLDSNVKTEINPNNTTDNRWNKSIPVRSDEETNADEYFLFGNNCLATDELGLCDVIDVQICVSKEVRQRVLLFQFFRIIKPDKREQRSTVQFPDGFSNATLPVTNNHHDVVVNDIPSMTTNGIHQSTISNNKQKSFLSSLTPIFIRCIKVWIVPL